MPKGKSTGGGGGTGKVGYSRKLTKRFVSSNPKNLPSRRKTNPRRKMK